MCLGMGPWERIVSSEFFYLLWHQEQEGDMVEGVKADFWVPFG